MRCTTTIYHETTCLIPKGLRLETITVFLEYMSQSFSAVLFGLGIKTGAGMPTIFKCLGNKRLESVARWQSGLPGSKSYQ